jgi:hypothetical protein
MAANGNFSVFVVRPFLLHRSRARSPKSAGGELMAAPAGPSRVSAQGGDDGDDQRAAGACGVVGDPADRRSCGQGALQRGDEPGQAGSRLPRELALAPCKSKILHMSASLA